MLTFPGGQVAIDPSTIFGNTGQGVLAFASTVTVDNSTISGTMHPTGGTRGRAGRRTPLRRDRGGQPRPRSGPVAALATAGWTGRKAKLNARPRPRGPETTVTGTIVADNTTLADCNGDVIDGGYNLDSDGSCAWSATGSISKAKAKLGPLADNGGPTETLLPAKGSDAIDPIPTGAAECSTDVRRPARGVASAGPSNVRHRRGRGRPAADRDLAEQAAARQGGHALPRASCRRPAGLGAPYEFSLAPSSDPLPDGLTLHADGKISGTPTKAGHFPITVSVDDPTLKDYVIVITAPAAPTTPVVTPPSSGPIANTGTPVLAVDDRRARDRRRCAAADRGRLDRRAAGAAPHSLGGRS